MKSNKRGEKLKMKHKNRLVLLVIVMAFVVLFAACSSPAATPAPAPAPAEPPAAAPEDTQPAAPAPETYPAETLTLATTTSVNDSGLLDYLAPFLKDEENITLDVLAQGSGQAIKTAQDGNADILIAHSPAAEQQFVDDGYGIDRQQFMYNYFVIAGPTADPANVAGADGAAAAFSAIYDAYKADHFIIFYSRDDASGTDTKEKGLWDKAGIDVKTLPADFYQRTGKGMLDTLVMADNTDGYTLTDKATLLANADKLPHLKNLFEKNDELKNVYSVTLINPEKYPDLNHEAATRFHDWLLSPSTQQRIAEYGVEQYGEALFFIG